MQRTIFKSRRSRTSCSLIALATVLAVGASPASAQSLIGTGSFTHGGGSITTAPNTTNISITSPQAVIDWSATGAASGGQVVFQNSGTVANFTGTSDFAVLNRISTGDPTNIIVMNGTVTARVGGVQRGSVYFYTPGGFIFGGSSVFSVGSLVATTLPIQMTGDNFIINNTVVFGQATQPASAIVNSGTISANFQPLGVGGVTSSYVAMVAPKVSHLGTITVNGSAALVAAEAATINFSPDGLFDIEVTVGSTDSTGIAVHGDITGPTPTGSTDKQGIYLVAVPKNDAMTMVIGNGANLGFTLANTAVDDNGVIVLSAGHDIVDGEIGDRSAGHGANAAGNFWFTGSHATNNLFGEATGYADLYSTDAQASQMTTVFDNDVTVHAVDHVWMNAAGDGSTLTVGGDLSLSTDQHAEPGGSATGGDTQLYAFNGGIVEVWGDMSLTADGFGGDSGESIAAGAGTGGNVSLSAWEGGSISIGNVESGGDVLLSASGYGGTGNEGGSGNGTGNTVNVQVSTDGDISIFGDTDVYAEGHGGTNWDSEANGGVGQGGSIFVGATGTGSTLSLTGALMSADGVGGGAGEGTCCAAVGGAGIGGLVSVFGSTGALIESNGTLELSAAGQGGLASGAGGNGSGGVDGDGVFVTAQSGVTFDITGSLLLDATGSGGAGDTGGGNGTGGHAALNVDGGTVTVSDEINVDADGSGGDSYYGGNGGTGTGGLAAISTNGATALLNAFNVLIEADGTGGDSFNFSEGPLGDGGDAFGGRTRASANDGAIHITGDLTMTATATGGTGANGGDATGVVTPTNNEGLPPAAFLWAQAATGELRVDGLTDIDVSATGGEGFDGDGGNASAGEVDIASRDGDVLLGDVIVNADAFGGDGSYGGGSGGNAFGGYIDVSWAIDQSTGLSGLISLETVALSANGYGGNGGEGLFAQEGPGGTGGAGGNGTGGGVGYSGSAGGGTLDVGSTTILANGIGGNGGHGGSGDTGGNGGAGGIGTGGFVQTGTISNSPSPTPGGTASFTFLSASASASGGAGGNGGEGFSGLGMGGDGGDAIGGQTSFLVRGVVVTADSVNLFANATGGDAGSGALAGNGGDAFTGFVSVESKDRFDHPTQRGSLTADSISGTAIAIGGTGAVDGTSTVRGGSFFRVLNGDADIGSVSFTFAGDLYDGAAVYENSVGPNFIQAQDGTATIGTFDYSTTGELAIYTTDTGSMDVGDLTLSAGNFIDHPTLVGPASLGTIYATNLSVSSGGDFIADAHFDVDNEIEFSVPGSIRFGDATSGWYVNLWADSGSIQVGDVDASSSVSLAAGTFIQGGDITAGGSIFGTAYDGNIALGTLTSSFGSISLFANNDIDLSGDALADGDILLTAGGNIVLNNATAGESIEIDAGGYFDEGGGYVDGLDLTAGDTIEVVAAEWVDLGDLSAGLIDPSFNEGADYTAAIHAGGNIVTGNIAAANHVGLATPGTMTTGDIDAGGIFMALGTGDMSFGDATAGDEIYLADYSMMVLGGEVAGEFDPAPILASAPTPTGGSITIGDVNTSRFTAAAGNNLTTGLINSDTAIGLDAGGAISTGDLTAGDFVLANGGSITTGNIDADSVEMASTGGDITTGDIFAFGDVELDAFGDIIAGDITGGSIDLFAGNDITTGDLTTHFLFLVEQEGGAGPQMLYPGASITLEAGGDIATGNIDSIDGVYADAGGALATGTIDAVDFVDINSVGNMTTGNIDAGSDLFADAGGAMSLGTLSAFDIELESGGNMTFVSANADTEFDFSSGGSVNGGNVTAGNQISGDAAGTVTLANLTVSGPPQEGEDFSIGMVAAGNITVGNVSGFAPVGFATQGNLTTGNVAAGDLFMALVGGNISINGSITTSGEGGGQVYMADDSMFFTGGGTIDGDGDFDPSIVLALDPVATGGSIAINGPVNTGQFEAAAGTGLTTQAITATGDIHASAGGTATLNGIWNSGNEVNLSSNDIDISNTGGINAAGNVGLYSTNATQALIGDGLSGSGYALSNAEFGRISGYNVGIGARGDASAAIDMLIGDLTVTGPLAGSTIEGTDGALAFAVGDIDSETISGVIRVNGDIAATGFGSSNAIAFFADRFELNAATGSVSILSSGSTLGGELGIFAEQIHVAEGGILDQLAANPTYTGYQQDLNEAASVQRPEGVLRADTLWIESDNLQSLLIQNTGTFETRAGFLVREAYINDDEEVAGPPGSINMVVNGQVVTEGGTLTGVDARDALVDEETDITPFTANSTINGCPLTGQCIIAPPPPPPTANLVENQIDLIGLDPIGEGEFEDNQEGDEGSSNPIAPPQPLFDTRPLVPSGDVNDPVSGTGNPALTGSEAQCEDEEDGQCAAPVDGDSQ